MFVIYVPLDFVHDLWVWLTLVMHNMYPRSPLQCSNLPFYCLVLRFGGGMQHNFSECSLEPQQPSEIQRVCRQSSGGLLDCPDHLRRYCALA